MKILIVEDEAELREIVRRTLLAERYVVEEAADYRSALQRIDDYDYDCILLDLNLPGGDGLALLEHLRGMRRRASVIILSARDSIDDKIRGLGLGADDYLPKPFHLAELTARVRSVLRRGLADGNPTIVFADLEVDPERFRVTVGGREVALLRKEYEIVHYFVTRPRHVIDKQTLAEAVWGDHADQSDDFSYVYAQVKNVRRKLREAGSRAEIRSVYGFGYKLVEGDPAGR